MATCGECQLCCKLMGVAELEKKRMHWCRHVVKGRGCGIYPDRPHSCRIFQCLWLYSQTNGDVPMPPELKPSVCGVVMDATNDGEGVVAHYNDGVSYSADTPVNRFLDRMSNRCIVMIKQRGLTMAVRRGEVLAQQVDPTGQEPVTTMVIDD